MSHGLTAMLYMIKIKSTIKIMIVCVNGVYHDVPISIPIIKCPIIFQRSYVDDSLLFLKEIK